MKALHKVALILFVVFSAFTTTSACTCSDYQVPICTLYKDADAVFVGKIVRISPFIEKDASVPLSRVNSISSSGDSGLIAVDFKIENALKGVQDKIVRAITYQGTSCDLEVKKGERWVIYAGKDKETGLLNFGFCGGNQKVNKDFDELPELIDISQGRATTTITGRVTLNEDTEVKNAKVLVEGNNIYMSSLTDSSGWYKFIVPQEGKYKVRVFVPYSATLFTFNDRDIKVIPTETETIFEYETEKISSCCDYEFLNTIKIDLKATAKINWRFSQNADNNFYTQLCRLKSNEQETLSSCGYGADKNADGSYSFGGLREGNFVLVISKKNFPEISSPFLRHYYPGVESFSEAKIITLEQGQKLNLPDFNLPSPIPMRKVEGKLFWKAGMPITAGSLDNRVYFQFYDPQQIKSSLDMSHYVSPTETKDGITLNKDGSFSFNAFIGMDYVVVFSAENKKGKEFSKEIRLRIDDNLKPLEIILDQKKKK